MEFEVPSIRVVRIDGVITIEIPEKTVLAAAELTEWGRCKVTDEALLLNFFTNNLLEMREDEGDIYGLLDRILSDAVRFEEGIEQIEQTGN